MKRMILTTAIMALLIAPVVWSQPFDSPRVAEKLGLSGEQKDQIHTLQIKHQKDMITRRAELKIAKMELREIMMDSKLNENAAISKQDNISKMKSDMARLKLQHKIAIRKILTDEQLKTWTEMRHEMGPRFGRHMRDGGRGMNRMGPPPMMGPGPGCGPGMDRDTEQKGE